MKTVRMILVLAGLSIGAILFLPRDGEEPIVASPEQPKRHSIEHTAPIEIQPVEASASKPADRESESSKTAFESIFGDREAVQRFNEAIYEELVTSVGSSHADLIFSLSEMEDWEEIKAFINEHGNADGELLMRYGLRTGQISAQEIADLWRSGIEIPPDAVMKIVGKLPIDDLLSLRNNGVPIDFTYQNVYSGKNALGKFIDEVTFSPGNYQPAQTETTIRKLIDAGVEFSPQGVEMTPLDFALRYVTEENANQKLAMTNLLLEYGVVPEQHQLELIDQMSAGT